MSKKIDKSLQNELDLFASEEIKLPPDYIPVKEVRLLKADGSTLPLDLQDMIAESDKNFGEAMTKHHNAVVEAMKEPVKPYHHYESPREFEQLNNAIAFQQPDAKAFDGRGMNKDEEALFPPGDVRYMPNATLKDKSIRILALDVATHCGWCTGTAYGVWDLSIKRDESSGMRLIRFKSKLREVCSLENINLVTFELSQGFHQNAVIVQSELHGVLKLFCEENKIDYRSFAPSEIKKHATGKGNSGKPQMVAAAKRKYGYTGNDDNTADAIHIYHLTKSNLGL